MKKKIIYLVVLTAILAGCSTSSKLTKGNVVSDTPDRVVIEKIKLNPEGDPETEQRQQEWSEQKAAMEEQQSSIRTTDSKSDATNARRPRTDRPKMTFTAAQGEYLHIIGINPLPASGVLELDLNAMASEFCYPVQGVFLSPYGMRGSRMHTGLDIKGFANDTIRAAFPGVVRMAKVYSDYGNLVAIRHYEGFETVYSHGSKILVKPNDVVEPGDPIMLAGRTGRATTEHLHFELRAGDAHIDPARILDTNSRSLRTGKLYITKLNGRVVAYADDLELERLKGTTKVAITPTQAPVAQQTTAAKPVDSVVPSEPIVRPTPVTPAVNIVTNAAPEAPNAAVYYKVQKGDTLYSIAKAHNTTVAKICQLSNITSTSVLQINQKLRVK